MKKKSVLSRPTICKNGTIISIQASDFHYCDPRINGAQEYNKFELNLLVEDKKRLKFKELNQYDDGYVFGYVPAELVQRLIDSFGGLASSPWPQFK